MKNLIVTFLLNIGSIAIYAQAPSLTWQKCFGGSDVDRAKEVKQTTDGGYIVAGCSLSVNGDITGNHGNYDYWVVKLDAYGSLQWQKSLGGSNIDLAYSIDQTVDGGYVVAGYSYSNDGDVSGNHGGDDFWVVKINDTGAIEWQKCYGGSNFDEAKSIRQTSDDGYIVAGYTSSNDGDVTGYHVGAPGSADFWVVKIDSIGNLQWEKSLGGAIDDVAYSVRQTTDGGYIVAGYTTSPDGDVGGTHAPGVENYWVVKLSGTGAIQWHKVYGGTVQDDAYAMQQTFDGGYILAGRAYSNDGDVSGNHSIGADYWVIKIDDTGAIEWQKCLGGQGPDWGYSVSQAADSGYIIAGVTQSINGDITASYGSGDFWVVKLSPQGMLQWQKSLGGSGIDWASSVITTTDGGYVVAGFTASNDIEVSGNHGSDDFWVVKLGGNLSVPAITPASQTLTVFPIPATATLTIQSTNAAINEVMITNLLGQVVYRIMVSLAEPCQLLTIDVTNYAPGIYLYQVITNGNTQSGKVLIGK